MGTLPTYTGKGGALYHYRSNLYGLVWTVDYSTPPPPPHANSGDRVLFVHVFDVFVNVLVGFVVFRAASSYYLGMEVIYVQL